jgi:hypothetical protein
VTKTPDEQSDERGLVVAFRAPAWLAAAAEAQATAEGITRSDVARRALIRDLSAAGKMARV